MGSRDEKGKTGERAKGGSLLPWREWGKNKRVSFSLYGCICLKNGWRGFDGVRIIPVRDWKSLCAADSAVSLARLHDSFSGCVLGVQF